jgi:hypothetical protein
VLLLLTLLRADADLAAVTGGVNHGGHRAARDPLKRLGAPWRVMEGDAGQMGGVELHLVADGRSEGEASGEARLTVSRSCVRHVVWRMARRRDRGVM